VAEPAKAIEGGHLFFLLKNGEGHLKCAAFEPTKNFRSTVKKLAVGDELEVFGAVRDGTLNLEKMNILQLAEQEVWLAPSCPQCGRRMESAGRDQGYRCRRCKTKAEGQERKVLPRDLETGYYEVPPSARRHLSKPLVRMNGEKVHPSR
jgi:tRNA(Ile2)-agmatinylcytidine synthase